MAEAEAHQKINAEIEKAWPEWRSLTETQQMRLQLRPRKGVFDDALLSVPRNRLSSVIQAVHRALGNQAGNLLRK